MSTGRPDFLNEVLADVTPRALSLRRFILAALVDRFCADPAQYATLDDLEAAAKEGLGQKHLAHGEGAMADADEKVGDIWETLDKLKQKVRKWGQKKGCEISIETHPVKGWRLVVARPPAMEGAVVPTRATSADSAVALPGPPAARSRLAWAPWAAGAVVLVALMLWIWSVTRPRAMPAGGEGEPATGTTDLRRIAVLPFDNISPDPKNEYFSDGMTEELIASLSKIGGLRVIARTSVTPYKKATKTAAQIGKELNVGNLVEGTVSQGQDKIRVTVRLVDAKSQEQLWQQVYDRPLSDVFEVESEIAQRVAQSLKVQLDAAERRRVSQRPTENLEAYDFYLRGRYLWSKRSKDAVEEAIPDFRQALARDPKYALAYAGLADSFVVLGNYGFLPPREAFANARENAVRALELDDSLAEAHTSLAAVKLLYDWDFPAADREFNRAIELNPSYALAHQWYALELIVTSRLEAAGVEARRAQELDPLSLVINTATGFPLYYSRQYDEAAGRFRVALDLDPNFALAHLWFGWCYTQKGDYPQAEAEFEKARPLSNAIAGLGYAAARAGQTPLAQQRLQELLTLAARQSVSPYDIAVVYAGLGEKDKTFEWLNKAYDQRSNDLIFLRVEPVLDGVRSDPRFGDLLKKMGL